MRKRSIRQDQWAQGGLKDVGRAALIRYNREVRPYRPRCNAKRKRDGERCENIASPNGKCRVHGGATPRGDEWHTPQWPSGSRPDWQKKLHEKLKRLDRDRRRLERRLAKMTADERAHFDRWQQDHKPGPMGPRAQRRVDRKSAAKIRKSLERDEPRPISPELAALQEQAAALEAERDRLLLRQIQDQPIGVFS